MNALESKKHEVVANGVHIIGDLNDCDLSQFVTNKAELSPLKNELYELIFSHGLEVLGGYFHFFGPHAVTATICLAESHINFHTWPESKLVTLDIFVCSYTQDNSQAAEAIYEKLVSLIFKAKQVKTKRVFR